MNPKCYMNFIGAHGKVPLIPGNHQKSLACRYEEAALCWVKVEDFHSTLDHTTPPRVQVAKVGPEVGNTMT